MYEFWFSVCIIKTVRQWPKNWETVADASGPCWHSWLCRTV